MPIDILDQVNDPGTPGRTGDDRFGFDAAAGRAWVIDGATDVTELRPFRLAESGAAWFAEAISRRLMEEPAPDEAHADYFAAVVSDVAARAARESALPLAKLPGEARPVAAMMWMAQRGRHADFVWAGDCFALVADPGGSVRLVGTEEKADAETEDARRMLEMTAEARKARLKAQRRAANAPENGLLSLDPAATRYFRQERLALAPGTSVLLMTDGLYRLVVPYGLDTPQSLMRRVLRDGLAGAITVLRAHEAEASGQRLKPRDDAAAVLIRS